MQEEAYTVLTRPLRSAQLTPPMRSDIWPSILEVLETPERKRFTAQNTVTSHNTSFQQPVNDYSMYLNATDLPSTTCDLSVNEDSGLGDSFFELSGSFEKNEKMILRPSPVVLRTPFVTNSKNLQSPLRSFFFKPSPPLQTDQLPSLTKSENAIGIRFNGNQLINLKSPCLLSTIQNQNIAPDNAPTNSNSNKRPSSQRSPLKPYQNSARNLASDLTKMETPSKGVKLEFGFDGLSPFVSPLKFSQPFYNDSFANEHANSFLDTNSMDMLDSYFGMSSSMDSSLLGQSSPLKSCSPDKSLKNDSLSSFSLSLNTTNESFPSSDNSADQPGSMSCTHAIRIKVPRFSARAKAIVYGRTTTQREMTRQANSFWKRNCRPNHQTGIPLAESLDEFKKIDFMSRSSKKSY